MPGNDVTPLSAHEGDTEIAETTPSAVPALPPATATATAPAARGARSRRDKEDKTETIPLSKEEKGLGNISEQRFNFQKKSLNRIRKLFQWFNIALFSFVAFFAIIEKIFPPAAGANIITDKVIIGIIAGITAQIGAVVLAAYKGMFAAK